MMWEIKDPQGFKHILERDRHGFYGSENLAHGYEPVKRPFVVSQLMFQIEKNPEQGEWDGFAWLRL